MGTSGNRDCQWASRSVLKDFTGNALTTLAGSLFQNWIGPNVEGELATARTTSLVVKIVSVAA